MKNLVVFAAAVVLATACIGAVVGCNSNRRLQFQHSGTGRWAGARKGGHG